MSQTKLRFPSVYNPATQSAEEIVSNFVVRLREFNELLMVVTSDNMKNPPQHFLIQGQRGYGKTTLLLRLDLAIKNDEKLNSWLIPIIFDEEQYTVHTLAKLWEKVLEIMEENDDAFKGLSEQIDRLYETKSPEEEIFKLLTKALKDNQKKLVLFIDNFGEIIEKFSKKENQRLREVLITSNLFRIIGTTSTVLEFYYNYKEPLFDFFKVITLAALNRTETILLLKKLSETYSAGEIDKILEVQPERIDAIRKLTGGVPRTIVLLFEIFVDDINGNSFKDLEMILDRVTPLYKHRMDNLSPQQQSIIASIAENWDAISTKDIANATRMSSKAVSSQLNQLEKNQLVEKIPTSTKNHLYQIKERFFNVYYLMRLGKRKNRNRVLWLIRFLEIWCCQTELVDRTKKHIAALRNERFYDKHAFFVSQALARTGIPLELQHELVSETRKFLKSKKSKYVKDLDHSRLEVFQEATTDIKQEHIEAAVKKLQNTGISSSNISFFIGNVMWFERKELKRAADFYQESIKKGNINAMNSMANLFWEEFGNFENAKEYFLLAIDKGDTNAMFNLGNLYREEFKNLEKAKEYYKMAVDQGHSGAINNLANIIWDEVKDFEKAKEYYLMAVAKGDINAMYNVASLFWEEFQDFEMAKKYFQMGINKGDPSAMYKLANLYREEFKDFKKAKEYYLMAVDKGSAKAMNNLANLFRVEFKDLEKAKEYYLMAVGKGDSNAMYNLANLFRDEFKDFEKAKEYYLMAVSKGDVSAVYNVAALFWDEFKDFEKAKEYYLMAVDRGHVGAMNNLANLFWDEFKDFEKAKEYFLMAIDKGHVGALNNLANLFRKEFKDIDKAREYYLMGVKKGDTNAMISLANLFLEEFKDVDKAKEYYLMSAEKGNAIAMNNLAWLYFELREKKMEALKIQKEAFRIDPNINHAHTLIMLLLWNDEIEKAIDIFRKKFENLDAQNSVNKFISSILIMFLAKKQFNYIYRLFQENKYDIKDKYKPIYYALLSLMGSEYQDESKKMGNELKETVQEIINEITKIAI